MPNPPSPADSPPDAAVPTVSPSVSVVVPTYRRMDVLPEVLDAIDGQRVPEGLAPGGYEVVVVDDGSGDATPDFLARRAAERPPGAPPLRVLSQENRGPAAARNAGVEAARGALVAFLGDDTVPSPGWLAAHLEAHRARRDDPRPTAVVGYTGWHPRMRLTPFLRYINEHGLQFGYALIEDPEDVPFNFFYTSNLSLPRELLLAEPFHLDFPYPAWEDIEAGYRLQARSMRLVYEPRAVTAHDHPTTLERFAVRQEKAGYSAVVFHRLHPELGAFLGIGPEGPPPLPPALPHRLREKVVRALQFLPVRLPRWWDETLRFHYIRGLHRGWADRQAGDFQGTGESGMFVGGGNGERRDHHEDREHDPA